MFSETVTGSIEGSIRGSLVGRTLVSHSNTSTTNSSSRRPDSAVGLGLSGLISNLGYATVNGDDNMNSGHNSGNGSPRDENIGMKREGGKKPMAAKTSVFSILPDDEDDDGEELEMI